MTRINCIPAKELHTKHLVAEYRELPRVFRLAEAAWVRAAKRSTEVALKGQPEEYVLGRGHVLFFYNKLGYCQRRFQELVDEMKSRGHRPNYLKPPEVILPRSWYQDWQPDKWAMQLNRERIQARMPK